MTQVRAFLAIEVPEEIKLKIYKVIKEFKQIDANIKYVELENLHLTLKFFGDIDTEGIGLLSEKIASVVSEFDTFKVNIKGCGAFPNTKRIKVIWLGLENDGFVRKLHDELDKEFVQMGFDKDRKFSTHLTIGRMRSAKGKDQVKSAIESFKEIEIGEMDVDKIVLKKSTLTPHGPIYEDLEIFEL
ncbi:RNA 2',3'-cyclic phosphodiesterase [uncultured Methanobrevibacter sp.]|uniref:RNA 2',3'-cyclic phosphodiesterase n=1 Tax=uncultured Methanobrevibacter sp. TaxID=253161 RepID=UPI00262E78C8|nr:RNA 2',3'-cyclic phosphodiesterase [uncultured Methanobrevibacter sp.]